MQLPLDSLRLAAIDFESIPVYGGHMPVQIGIAGGTWREIQPSLCWGSRLSDAFDDPDTPDEALPRLVQLWPKVRSSLEGRWLVAHGAGTERRFLRAFPGHRFGPWIDTLRWVRAVYPALPSHALSDVCTSLGLEPAIRSLGFHAGWHDALFDAVASLLLLQHMWKETSLVEASPELLTRPNLSPYFRQKKS